MRTICSLHSTISKVLIVHSNQPTTLWLSQDWDYTYSVVYALINLDYQSKCLQHAQTFHIHVDGAIT